MQFAALIGGVFRPKLTIAHFSNPRNESVLGRLAGPVLLRRILILHVFCRLLEIAVEFLLQDWLSFMCYIRFEDAVLGRLCKVM